MGLYSVHRVAAAGRTRPYSSMKKETPEAAPEVNMTSAKPASFRSAK